MRLEYELEEIVRLIKEGKFYKSSAWEKKRLEILERDNYECQVCKEEGGFTPATTVHHILHLENRPDLAFDNDNLLSVCAACHNREHPERFIHRIMEPSGTSWPSDFQRGGKPSYPPGLENRLARRSGDRRGGNCQNRFFSFSHEAGWL